MPENLRVTIDLSRERLQMDVIVDWLQNIYWARDRSRDDIVRSWNASAVVAGAYLDDVQIGCARVVSDCVSVAYLADVYIDARHRGLGYGHRLLETLIHHPDLQRVRWLLHTRDAHELYRQFGFVDPGDRLLERWPPA